MIPNIQEQSLRLSQQDFEDLLQQYPEYTSILAYLSPLIEGSGEVNTDDAIFENLRTTVIEHPLSLLLGEYRYQLRWQTDEAGNHLHGVTVDGQDLTQVLDRGIDHTDKDYPHEKERALKNKEFYFKALTARKNGYTGPLIEFSPNPSLAKSLGKDSIPRNYHGWNDALFIWEATSDSFNRPIEKVEQIWFPMATIKDYENLFRSIAVAGFSPLSNSGLEDLEIMSYSGGFNDQQVDAIRMFAKHKQQDFISQRGEIDDYVERNILPQVQQNIMPEIKRLQTLLNVVNDRRLIESQLQNIANLINVTALEVSLLVRDVIINKRGDANEVLGLETLGEFSLTDLQSMSLNDRKELIIQSGFKAFACNIKIGSGSTSIFGGNSSVIGASNQGLPDNFGNPEYYQVCKKCSHLAEVVGGCGICVSCHNFLQSKGQVLA